MLLQNSLEFVRRFDPAAQPANASARLAVQALLVATAVIIASGNNDAGRRPHHAIVVLGCNGDLARKYLWRGFFELFLNEQAGATFSFYGCGRSSIEEGSKTLSVTLDRIGCQDNTTYCVGTARAFRSAARYLQLVGPADYAHLGELLASDPSAENERSRWFYLAIPPRDYGAVSDLIAKYCRPAGATSLKVIFEKPFGHDLQSAVALAKHLEEYFTDDEVYRIDHYLGKQAARAILPFRQLTGIDRYWTRAFVERIEVVLNEQDSVAGRMGFYDGYGVIRDMLQNHVTELVLLITMNLPLNISDQEQIQNEKLRVLAALEVAGASARLQQYDGYLHDLQQETGRSASATPTFASFAAAVHNRRWSGVPIQLTAGKKMPGTCKYVKVVFKPGTFGGSVEYSPLGEQQQPRSVVSFNFGCPEFDRKPSEPASQGEALVLLSSDVAARLDTRSLVLSSREVGAYTVWEAAARRGAYDVLIEEIHRGAKGSFVGGERLLASWRLWSPVIEQLEASDSSLSARGEHDSGVVAAAPWTAPVSEEQELSRLVGSARALHPPAFMGRPLHSGSPGHVIRSLLRSFVQSVSRAVRQRGVAHVALSGGRSPAAFLRALASAGGDGGTPDAAAGAAAAADVRWERVHVWLVDERCVPPASDASTNAGFLLRHLVDRVPLPFANVHPVVLEIRGEAASSVAAADCRWSADLYEARIRRLLPGLAFDFVLLGLGEDGHTASLFPGHPALVDEEAGGAGAADDLRLAVYVPVQGANASAGEWRPPVSRVSLTFAAIARARSVAVLVLGAGKHRAVRRLADGACAGALDCPMLGVHSRVREADALQWYIDADALGGS